MHTEGYAPGRIALLGSGETSPAGGRVLESLVQAHSLSAPLRVAVLETPAGFEPNSDRVAGRVAGFLAARLSNYRPKVDVVPARRRGTLFTPDDAAITAPLLAADLIFMGPGSPTYAVRQLQGSLAWQRMIARQRFGATLALASAAVVAIGKYAMPVYEIYKVGHELHWQPGLDLFGAYGLNLVFVPHWNNAEGGAELDTGRCFMGRERFEVLQSMLPPAVSVIGIDEHTALIVDITDGIAEVMGVGSVTVQRGAATRTLPPESRVSLAELGSFTLPEPSAGLPPAVWAEALAARRKDEAQPPVPAEVCALVNERQAARQRHNWALADELRSRISALGWQVRDTPEGPVVHVLATSPDHVAGTGGQP